ncbi:MAG: CDP-alcohol phosphatidyltransferase family protein [Beijerinckiaceae bacterium]|nr:CDP-alcohol phosphatidyltransferase family protein [Beijerinckiaceae bacterium]MCZ8301141.1 CDP-alcohol phosphatidyltransferase family protein [Beijerinckiaceae bacterium]
MFDARLQGVIQPVLRPVARWLDARGIRADQVTLAGFVGGILVVPALAAGAHGVALALILANRIADGLDGALARLQGPTDRGAFLDIALDFAFYGLVVLGFALSDPVANALPAAFLLAAFMGTGSSFLAFAVLAARRGMSSTAFPRKGIYYIGGLTEGAETIAVFIAMALWPQAFPVLAMLFALACWITAIMRWRLGWEAFAPKAPQ